MDTAIDLSDASKALDLANIRFQLIRLEDTIIFHLIERVQFPLNAAIYDPVALPIPNSNLSLTNYLQALSRRIHFGKFVAESKFLKDTTRFVELIKNNDREGIDAAITDAKVERKVLERLKLKAKT